MKFHELANIFPLMEGEAFDGLRADIEANGLRDHIVTLDDKILDGRNRFLASKAARYTIPAKMFRVFDPAREGDPLAWVISKNLQRRHLNETQRGNIAAKLETLKHGGDRKSDQDANLHVDRETAAKMLNVSVRTVATAAAVRNNPNTTPELLAAVEQGKISISLAKQAADLPAAEQYEIAERAVEGDTRIVKKVVKRRAREKRERELAGKIEALPNVKAGVIYEDAEWKFITFSGDGKGSTAAENHYPTSNIEDIRARDVASIAADDCVLFMWATQPMLDQQIEVMKDRGFKYVSHTIWRKTGKAGQPKGGTGHWFLNHHEILLVGTRGNIPCPAPGTQWPSVIEAPRGRHSEKPDVFYELIERYFPNVPKIELNARKQREGWLPGWGLEAPKAEAAE